MSILKKIPFHGSLMILSMILGLAAAAFAVPTVSITGPTSSCLPANPGEYTICASASTSTGTITRVVFYRNDVPYETDTAASYQMTSSILGQDTYVFRARAYDSTGLWADSTEINYVVNTPQVYTMGVTHVSGMPSALQGPGAGLDHTIDVQTALDKLSSLGGGTLFFPCPVSSTAQQAIYTISSTIRVPPNVTLQGEGSERWGKCRIYWYKWANIYGSAPTPPPGQTYINDCRTSPAILKNRPMFQIIGNSSRVRFRDLAIYSRASGNGCYPRDDYTTIASDETAGIEMNSGVNKACFADQFDDPEACGEKEGGEISDVIFDNISVNDFTYGIKAVGNPAQTFGISGVKTRGVRAQTNHRQLYINSPFAYDWDMQNFNITSMAPIQGGIQIEESGYPSSYWGMNPGLKFLMLNCNGSKPERPEFCVQVKKHGGLYFRQMHHEGAPRALDVKVPDVGTNTDPIVLESSVASGRFEDPNMILYLVANYIQAPDAIANGLDDARLRFINDGVNADVYDCGDVHSDWTDVQDDGDPYDTTVWGDLKMLFTHMERNRASFFADNLGYKYLNGHRYCVEGQENLPNTSKMGGLYFDNGVLPSETGVYSQTLDFTTAVPLECVSSVAACIENRLDYRPFGSTTPPAYGGTLYIKGHAIADRTIRVPRGAQIVGAPGARITLDSGSKALFEILIPSGASDGFGQSGTVIRDLALDATPTTTATGIDMPNESVNAVGVSRDLHFSRLSFEGFDIGIGARPSTAYPNMDPMIDGITLKQIAFYGNGTATKIDSNNASNWNVMNVSIEAKTNQIGWQQVESGFQSIQHMTCSGGASNRQMADCIRLRMSGGLYVTDLRQPTFTKNAIHIEDNVSAFGGIYTSPLVSTMVLRDSDFSSPGSSSPNKIKIVGKSFIGSFNNKYSNFDIGSAYEGDKSRITSCGDAYSSTKYTGLSPLYKNLWVGVDTPTFVECGARPIPWENPVTLGGASGDQPLKGNFFDDVEEDLVVFRTSGTPQFQIKSQDAVQHKEVNFGSAGDIGLTAHLVAGQNSQIVTWTPSNGKFQWVDPIVNPTPSPTPYYDWGTNGDVPFVGNFFDDPDNLDELAVYREDLSTNIHTIWVIDPRTGTYKVHGQYSVNYGKDIHVGDFLGLGYDQMAQFQAGKWYILNLDTGFATPFISFGNTTGDVAVPGNYLPQVSGLLDCDQFAVWRSADQKFLVRDAISGCGTRTESTYNMIWGSNNDLNSSNTATDDKPFAINNENGIARPSSYRPDVGVFPKSVAAGQWWIHDPFTP